MIIQRMIGGLGNQFFQYAAARKLSISHETDLKLDIFEYQRSKFRQFLLMDFKINADIAKISDIFQLNPREALFQISHKIFPAKLEKLCDTARSVYYHDNKLGENKLKKITTHIVAEQNLDYACDFFAIDNNSYISGYWLSYKYFEDIKEILINELSLKNIPSTIIKKAEIISKEESVAVHVRRTDKVNDAAYHVFTSKFYTKAINFLQNRRTSLKFYVFTDDIPWAKKEFSSFRDIKYIENPDLQNPTNDFYLMKSCKHFIVPCSSFSWWGAWLGEQKDSLIVLPPNNLWINLQNCTLSELSPPHWNILHDYV